MRGKGKVGCQMGDWLTRDIGGTGVSDEGQGTG